MANIGQKLGAKTLATAAARDYRAAIVLLKARGLLTPPSHKLLASLFRLPTERHNEIELRINEMIFGFGKPKDPADAASKKSARFFSGNVSCAPLGA